MKISAVILAKNEEATISDAIASASFCNEVLVVDDGSTDQTADLSAQAGAKVNPYPVGRDFSKARRYAQERAAGDYVLFLDADERISSQLKRELEVFMKAKEKENSFNAYYIKRRDFWWGRELRFGETLAARTRGIIRLVRKNTGKWTGLVHEEFMPDGTVGSFGSFIDHYPHPTLKEFITHVNVYSSMRARQLYGQKKKTNIFEICLFPFAKFLLTYVLFLGFLDGAPGFAYSFLMSFHSFLVRSKLYLLNHGFTEPI